MGMVGNYQIIDKEIFDKIQDSNISVEDVIYVNNVDKETKLDIDKSWHAIHFTLTGSKYDYDQNDPFSKIVLGGTMINEEDVGYGPATYFTPNEVNIEYQAIKDITVQEFKDKFDLNAMIENDIYPVLQDEDYDEFFDYV